MCLGRVTTYGSSHFNRNAVVTELEDDKMRMKNIDNDEQMQN